MLVALAAAAALVAPLALTAVPSDLDRYLDGDAGVDRAALVASLRARGPAGLGTALAAVARHPDSARADDLVEGVAGQLHAREVGAYWYTNLDDALAAAKREHKPVLSLRLLGRLDDELSCANSRFFRSLVYPDPEVARLLRDKFVLHWQSVRGAPVVTIDMGDGRKLVSTITGNSAHFVLDEDGAVADVIPGLYDARAFASQLAHALVLAKLPAAKRAAAHESALAALEREFRAQYGASAPLPELAPHLEQLDRLDVPRAQQQQAVPVVVPAFEASAFAITKAVPERRMLRLLDASPLPADSAAFARVFEPRAKALASGMTLSPAAERIFRSQLAPGVDAGAARTKTLVAMATDDMQNEFLFHRAIHRWLASGAGADAPALQRRIYDELFRTPDTDPWIGLIPADAYTGVAGGGVTLP